VPLLRSTCRYFVQERLSRFTRIMCLSFFQESLAKHDGQPITASIFSRANLSDSDHFCCAEMMVTSGCIVASIHLQYSKTPTRLPNRCQVDATIILHLRHHLLRQRLHDLPALLRCRARHHRRGQIWRQNQRFRPFQQTCCPI
jgi:hypothetical protein